MAFTATYGLYLASLGSGTIRGITAQGGNLGIDILAEADSGEVAVRTHFITARKPTFRFTTEEVAAALAATGTLGVDLAVDNLYLYGHKRAAGSTFASGSNHRAWKVVHGILVPTNLNVDHRGNCSLDYEAHVTYDGANAPVQILTAQALPAAGGTISRNTLGAVTAAGLSISQIVGVRIAFGLTVETEGSDSEIDDSEATIRLVDPRITVRTTDPAAGALGIDGATGALSITLRAREAGSGIASSGHTVITGTGSMAVFGDMHQTGQRDSGVTTIECAVDWDGTNDPLVVT